MNKQDLKALRKAAFAIGFSFTFGKWTARIVATPLGVALERILAHLAELGNEPAIEYCKTYGVKYQEKEKKNNQKN